MDLYTPPFGLEGLYQLKAPFDTKLVPSLAYKCTAVRSVSDLTSSGVDVFAQIYQPENLTIDVYNADLAAGMVVVTLESSSSNVVYVPNTYIVGAPDLGGVPYKTIILGVMLSIMPENVDLSNIKAKIIADVADLIGVETDVKTIIGSGRLLLTKAVADATEATRQTRIATTTTDAAQKLALQTQLTEALTQNQALSAYITSLGLPPTNMNPPVVTQVVTPEATATPPAS